MNDTPTAAATPSGGLHFSHPVFLKSATNVGETPPNACYIVFAGRSNAGKSSVLNTLCGGRFARVSKTPGRTRAINLFTLGEILLADLPGYGYAAVSKKEQAAWRPQLTRFLMKAQICCLATVIDCRRGIGELDKRLFALCQPRRTPVLIILNKSDQLTQQARAAALAAAQQQTTAPVILFSARRKTGVTEVRQVLDDYVHRYLPS